MFGIQSVDLRAKKQCDHYDARTLLSHPTLQIYESVLETLGLSPSEKRPYVWDDNEQSLDTHISLITQDIIQGGAIKQTMKNELACLQEFTR
jgi:phenylalanine ammonia-lyase